jgi:hypothetical protein
MKITQSLMVLGLLEGLRGFYEKEHYQHLFTFAESQAINENSRISNFPAQYALGLFTF